MDSNKLKLTFLLLIAVVPISLATWYFSVSENQGRIGTTNKGTLVIPVIDLTTLGLLDADGKPAYLHFDELTRDVDPKDYKARPWQVIYLGGSDCDDACIDRLYFLRQIHVRLGGEAKRVQRAYAQVGGDRLNLSTATEAAFKEQQADMQVFHGSREVLEKALSPSARGRDPVAEHFIYVADPVGNIMLYFTPENTLSDLNKLLKSSSLG